jgi:iron only hydrogenase large subunit-like protein
MTCPGGCINGGGQPLGADLKAVRRRMTGLYDVDGRETVRTSHSNASVKRLYQEYLGEPLGHESHQLLHTQYTRRETLTSGCKNDGEPGA